MTSSGSRKCACGKVISGNALACLACADGAGVRPHGGVLEILNVQGGDVKITFDKDNVSEAIRARRIVTDMLRRGYALVVEVDRGGVKAYERVQKFDEARGEYIIADLDSIAAEQADTKEAEEEISAPAPAVKKRSRPSKSLPMESTRATAIGRSAGG